MKLKRSQKRIITKQSKILRYMRISRKVSMREAGHRVDCSDSAISHYEHGRMDISPEVIERLVRAYGYKMEDFNALLWSQDIAVLNFRDACIELLDRLDETKLQAVHAMLRGFAT